MKNTMPLIGLLLLLQLSAAAQKSIAKREIEQINRTYEQLTQLRLELDYEMYATHTSSKAIDKQQAVYSRNGDAVFYRLGPMEMLTTSAFSIAADHEGKELVVGKAQQQAMNHRLGTDLDAFLQACDTVLISYPAPGLCLLQLDVEMPDVERVELCFVAMSKMLRKVTLYYREVSDWEEGKAETKARMEITYRRQDSKPDFAKDLFLTERFIQKTNGVLVPSPAFRDYELHDNTRF